MKRQPAKLAVKSYAGLIVVVVTFAVLGSALFIMLASGYDAAAHNWAIGAITGITGFWLGGEVASRRRG